MNERSLPGFQTVNQVLVKKHWVSKVTTRYLSDFQLCDRYGGVSYADHLSAANPEQAMMAEIGMADDELRMLALAHRDVERDPNALNVKLEDFFHHFDDTVRRVLRFLQFPEGHIPAMAGRSGPRICHYYGVSKFIHVL